MFLEEDKKEQLQDIVVKGTHKIFNLMHLMVLIKITHTFYAEHDKSTFIHFKRIKYNITFLRQN